MTTVSSGNSASSLSATATDPLTVLMGGVVTSATVETDATATDLGTVISTTVLTGGNLAVSSGGTASATQLISSGGTETLFSGGVESGADITSGQLEIENGGSACDLTLNSGGAPIYTSSGQPASLLVADNVSSATLVEIESGGVLDGAVLGYGAINVESGGSANNIETQYGIISGNAVANATYSIINVSAGGYISNAQIFYEDCLTVWGSADSTVIGGTQSPLVSDKNASGAVIPGRVLGTEEVVEGASAVTSNDKILSGGGLYLLAGSAINPTVGAGGTFYIVHGVASDVNVSAVFDDNPDYSLTDAEAVLAGGSTVGVDAHGGYISATGSSTTVSDISLDSSGLLRATHGVSVTGIF